MTICSLVGSKLFVPFSTAPQGYKSLNLIDSGFFFISIGKKAKFNPKGDEVRVTLSIASAVWSRTRLSLWAMDGDAACCELVKSMIELIPSIERTSPMYNAVMM